MSDFLEDLDDFFDEKIVVPMLEFSRRHPRLPLIISIIALIVSLVK